MTTISQVKQAVQPLLQRNGRRVRPDPDFDGDLEPLIHAWLVWRKTGKIAGDDKDELPA